MKLTQKQGEKLAEFIAAFLINGVIFGVSSIFTNLSFGVSILYSLINALWMPFLLFPLLTKISKIKDKKKKYELKPLLNYVENFEKRQIEIKSEVDELERIEQKKLEKFKFNWKLFRKHLKNHNIKYIYHFTDKSNLDSIIKNGGLFSWQYCIENKIIINNPGGDELSHNLDRKKRLENFIRLSFTPNHPMMYFALREKRITNPIVLKIDTEVIFWKNTKFSDANANSKNCKIGGDFDTLSTIDLKTIIKYDYYESPEEKKKYYQAEIMVESHIPIKYIQNVYEYSEN